MRKNAILLLMLIVLLIPQIMHAGDVVPQTRQEVIQLEGMDETITTTYVISDKGYSMWIDTEYLVQQPEYEGGGIDLYASPYAGVDFRCELVIYQSGLYEYSFDQAMEDTRQILVENYGNADSFENVDIFTITPAGGFYTIADDSTIIYYLVGTDTEVFHLVITCPHEAVEGFASCVIWMLKSFEIQGIR